MKLKKYLIILTTLIVLAGCSKDSDVEDTVVEETVVTGTNITNTYTKEVFLSQEPYIDNPKGILYYDNYLYIVNSGSDTIAVYDTEGQFIKELGESGGDEGEFDKPITIAADDEGNLYIGEEGNGRIQVIDRDGNYLREYPVDRIHPYECFMKDIEVDGDKNVYVTFQAFTKKKSNILKIDKDGKQTNIGKKLVGVLGKNKNGEIIYGNSHFISEKSGEKSVRTGNSYLSIIEDDMLKKIGNIEYGYAPSDIVCTNDSMIIYSITRHQLDKFSMDGEYIETLSKLSNEDIYSYSTNFNKMYLAIDEEENIYATINNSIDIYNDIYIFRKNK